MPGARGRVSAAARTAQAAVQNRKVNVAEKMRDESYSSAMDVILKIERNVKHHAEKVENATAYLEKMVSDALKTHSPSAESNSNSVAENRINSEALKQLCKLFKQDGDQQERLDILGAKRRELERQNDSWRELQEGAEARMKQVEDDMLRAVETQQQRVEEAEESEQAIREQLDEFHKSYAQGNRRLKTALASWKAEEYRLQKEIYYIESELTGLALPPGPYMFRWVASERWQLAVMIVIQANMLCNFLSFTRPEHDLSILDSVFLLFYVVELASNVIYYQNTFFTGTKSQVSMRVVDVLIVALSLVEVLLRGLHCGGNSHVVFRFLMVFRCLRFWKFVQIARQLHYDFVEHADFQAAMLCIICANCLLMGIEDSGQPLWVYVNNVFCVLYFLELLSRIRYYGKAFFWGSELQELLWNYFDLAIVTLTCITLWVIPTVVSFAASLGMEGGNAFADSMAKVISVGRMGRLLRVLRLVEMLKNIQPVYILILSMERAKVGSLLVFILAGGTFGFVALVGVKLIGGRWIMPADLSPDVEWVIQKHFTHVGDLMFCFFKAMNGDVTDLTPLLRVSDFMIFAVIGFVVIMKWGLFPIIVGVYSNAMNAVTDERKRAAKRVQEEKQRQETQEGFEKLFNELDTDGSGSVDTIEFHARIQERAPVVDALCRLSNLEVPDMEELFTILSTKHGKERIKSFTLDEFLKLLNSEAEQVTVRTVIDAERSIEQIESSLLQHGLEHSGVNSHFFGDSRTIHKRFERSQQAFNRQYS